MSEKYQGWANYPTWNVKVWIDNDEGSYNLWRGAARQALDTCGGSMIRREAAMIVLAEQLEEHHDRTIFAAEEFKPSWQSDCLQWSIGQVDWREIAEAYIEEAWDTGATRND
jgi:hypothetical protein